MAWSPIRRTAKPTLLQILAAASPTPKKTGQPPWLVASFISWHKGLTGNYRIDF